MTTTSAGRQATRPPGPPFRPAALLAMLRRDTPPWRFAEIAHTFPRIASLRLGATPVYLVTHPDLVRELLVVQAKAVEKGPALKGAGVVLGDGLLTMPNDRHRARRQLVNPAFHHSLLAGYAETMTAASRELSAAWAQRAGQRVDMSAEMAALTLDIVGRSLFGVELGDDAAQVYSDIGQAMAGWERMMLPGGARLMRLPLPAFKRMWSGAAGLDAVVRRLIAACGQRQEAQSTDAQPADAQASEAQASEAQAADRPLAVDVVGNLLAARVDGEQLPAGVVRDETMTLLLAGHETTANLLTWAWHLLSRHPQDADRLRREVARLGRPPSYADLPQLPFSYAVVAEVLRLFPPAWVLEREVTTELELDGWRLPPGSIVLASQFALHRDPRFWSEPAAFRPQRWLTEEGSFSDAAPGQPRGAWFPFGAGTRVCVGESFAWTEAVLVLACLAPDWAPVTDPAWRERLHAAVTLRPHGGLPMTLQRAGAV